MRVLLRGGKKNEEYFNTQRYIQTNISCANVLKDISPSSGISLLACWEQKRIFYPLHRPTLLFSLFFFFFVVIKPFDWIFISLLSKKFSQFDGRSSVDDAAFTIVAAKQKKKGKKDKKRKSFIVLARAQAVARKMKDVVEQQ